MRFALIPCAVTYSLLGRVRVRPLDCVSSFPLAGIGAGASLGELLRLVECRQSRNERVHVAGDCRHGHIQLEKGQVVSVGAWNKCIEWETGVFIRVVYTDGSERDVPSVPLAQGTSEGSCDGSMGWMQAES